MSHVEKRKIHPRCHKCARGSRGGSGGWGGGGGGGGRGGGGCKKEVSSKTNGRCLAVSTKRVGPPQHPPNHVAIDHNLPAMPIMMEAGSIDLPASESMELAFITMGTMGRVRSMATPRAMLGQFDTLRGRREGTSHVEKQKAHEDAINCARGGHKLRGGRDGGGGGGGVGAGLGWGGVRVESGGGGARNKC